MYFYKVTPSLLAFSAFPSATPITGKPVLPLPLQPIQCEDEDLYGHLVPLSMNSNLHAIELINLSCVCVPLCENLITGMRHFCVMIIIINA